MASPQNLGPVSVPAPKEYKIVKRVTREHLKLEDDTLYHIKIVKAMRVDINVTELKEGSRNSALNPKAKEPPTIIDVIDLDFATEATMIVNAIMKSELGKQYPDDSYVGKCFEYSQFKVRDKSYNMISLAEIEDPQIKVSTISQPTTRKK